MEKRFVISDLIQLYRDLPCLWDLSCEGYKDIDQRSAAWELMLEKYRDIEPEACVAAVKKKIDNLRTAYKREAKKVIDSKKHVGFSNSDIMYRPNLWYYEMMTFLDNKEDQQQCVIDPLTITRDTSDDLSEHEERFEKRREREPLEKGREREPQLKRKKHKLVDTVNEFLKQTPKNGNSFGLYVGEQLECMPTLQRHIAEKLIAEIIFLGKTENLNFDSRVETPSGSRSTFPSHSSSRKTSCQYSPLPQLVKSSPPYQYHVSYSPPSPNQLSHRAPSSPHFQTVQFTPQVLPSTSSLQIQTQPTIKLPLSPQYLSSDSALFSPQIHPPYSTTQNETPIVQTSIPSPPSTKIISGSESMAPNTIERLAGALLKEHIINIEKQKK